MRIDIKPMYGYDTDVLLDNPDRGFRLETKMNVFTGLDKGKDSLELLDETISKYKEDRPKITQHYFYLTEYQAKDLDAHAFENMNKYFDRCRKNGIKVLLRFAYILNDTRWAEEDAETEQILRHIDQLQEFITENRDVIYAYQAGYLGPWGEWSGGAKQDRFTVLDHMLDNIPEDLPVMVRYVWIKNVLDEFDARRARVSYHDDYIIDRPHGFNTGAKDDSQYYPQLTAESPYFTIDGEMPWGWDKTNIDGIAVAKRLSKHHFTTFSIEHNYKERGGEHSIEQWKKVTVTRQLLTENELPFNPNWFLNSDGIELERSCYEYLRDYLGYYIEAKSIEIIKNSDFTEIKTELVNYGFSAPHTLKISIVLLDKDNNIIAAQSACKAGELQTNKTVVCDTYFRSDMSSVARFGINFIDHAGNGARLANDCEYVNGVNVLGSIYF